jgi:HPt (histidine-containing phosphotransfer) domain-containing protein
LNSEEIAEDWNDGLLYNKKVCKQAKEHFYSNHKNCIIMSVEKLKTMNERMQSELDKLWNSGSWSEEKLETMKTEHLRTSY